MRLRSIGGILLRRWPLTILGLLVTVLLVADVVAMSPPQYQTTGSVVLIPPKDPDHPEANRYLGLSNLDQAIDVVVRSLGSDETREAVAEAEPDGAYDVVRDWTSGAPILIITASGTSSAEANAVLDAVLQQVPDVLTKLQGSLSIAEGAQITQLALTRDATPQLVLKPVLRAAVATGGLTLAFLLGLIAAVDNLILRRSRRRALAGEPPGPESGDETVPLARRQLRRAAVAEAARDEPAPDSETAGDEPAPEAQPVRGDGTEGLGPREAEREAARLRHRRARSRTRGGVAVRVGTSRAAEDDETRAAV